MPMPLGAQLPVFDGAAGVAAQARVAAERRARLQQQQGQPGSLIASALVPAPQSLAEGNGAAAVPAALAANISSSMLASALQPAPAGNGLDERAAWLDAGPPFHIRVSGYERGHPVRYKIMVHRGSVSWPIRRRFREVIAVHHAILHALGPRAYSQGLPRPPPRVSFQSMMCGDRSRAFLTRRAGQIQEYFDALLRFIPEVDHCEVLYDFLCHADLVEWDYDSLVSLGEMIGPAEEAAREPLSDEAVAKLPRACTAMRDGLVSRSAAGIGASIVDTASCSSSDDERGFGEVEICVICQDPMDLQSEEDDVRLLPCGHQFHFACVARWLKERNSCCVCQGVAVNDVAACDAAAPAATPATAAAVAGSRQ